MKEKILHNWEILASGEYKDNDWHIPSKDDFVKLGYYPKEFVKWTYFQDKKIIVSDKTGIRLKTVDELYNDWVKDK